MSRNFLRKLFTIFLCFLTLFPFFTGCKEEETLPNVDLGEITPFTEEDFLKTEGTILVNGKGEKVILQGTNLGGWLHMEGWMDGGGGIRPEVWGNHYAMLTALLQRFTPQQVEELLEIYQTAYIQTYDLQYLASLGFNLVRVPFFWTEIMDFEGNIRPHAFDQLDWVIAECTKLRMYVMLDLHGAPGGHSGGWTTGGHSDSNELWTNEQSQAWAVKIWETLATRYKDNPTVCGYDLLNEPVPPDDSPITHVEMYDMLYKAVRAIDEKHICVMGAFYNFDCLTDPKTVGWENVVYQTHHYDHDNKSADGQDNFACGQINYIAQYQRKWNIPVFAGEFNFLTFGDAWNTWLSTLTGMNVSWASWTYKNTSQDESLSWGIFHLPKVQSINYQKDSYETIAKKWKGYETKNYRENIPLKNIFLNGTKKRNRLQSADILTIRADGQSEDFRKMLDGNYCFDEYRWTNGKPQQGDGLQIIQLQLREEKTLERIELYTESYDYTQGYEVSALIDGKWQLLTKGAGRRGTTVIEFESVTTDKLKIKQTGVSDCWWSINELSIYTA